MTTNTSKYYIEADYPSLGAEEIDTYSEVFDEDQVLAELSALSPLQGLTSSPEWPALERWANAVEMDAVRVLIDTEDHTKAARMRERIRLAREIRDLPEVTHSRVSHLRATLEEDRA